ncbi:hypothetical protein HPP05_11890 [Corallococcus exiguus]|uniref:2OG-Fe(II) oxygenase n=1 Tax=Corallococcus exiguus TaxID=83462 RepID=UPI001493EF83|nr:hypothetical protein [Corallococcus exiguus]
MPPVLRCPSRIVTGGRFGLTEQHPRMQCRADVIPMHQGDEVAFAVHHCSIPGGFVCRAPEVKTMTRGSH